MDCSIGFRCLCQRKRIKRREEVEIPVGKGEGEGGGKGLVVFEKIEKVSGWEDLLNANAEVIAKGRFGAIYKANLENNPVVVKRLKDVEVSDKKFREIFDVIGKTNHENLLPLKAYHCSKDEKFLVYDYMPVGSLSALLHNNRGDGEGTKTPLNWNTRLGIFLGVARAIAHLHSQGPKTSHGNIKASNILLTTGLEARVSGYLPNHLAQSYPATKDNEFDVGYSASEVTKNGEASQKADVYSFGVVVLELLTGKTPIFQDEFTSEKVNLRNWILSVAEDELTSEVFELDLLRYENVEEDMVRVLQVALDCTAHDPRSRPSMAEVTRQIEELCGRN